MSFTADPEGKREETGTGPAPVPTSIRVAWITSAMFVFSIILRISEGRSFSFALISSGVSAICAVLLWTIHHRLTGSLGAAGGVWILLIVIRDGAVDLADDFRRQVLAVLVMTFIFTVTSVFFLPKKSKRASTTVPVAER